MQQISSARFDWLTPKDALEDAMLTIDRVSQDDLKETAALHHRHLHMGLFPKMGKGFLRHYQDTFADSPYGIALVARDQDGIVGALFGTTSNASHYHWVLRHRGLELAAFGSLSLMLRPRVAYDFATSRLGRYSNGIKRHLFNKSYGTASSSSEAGGPLSVLSHIVTRDGQRRCGVGRGLVEEFRRLAGVHGASQAVLVTEEGGLGIPFFERIGCDSVVCKNGFDGRSVREYRLKLNRNVGRNEALSPDRSRSLVRNRPELTAARSWSTAGSTDAATLH